MKKIVLILEIIIFLMVFLYTGFLALVDTTYTTIKVESQNEYIVKEIKEHFKIDYDIAKIKFYTGIPDGYYLNIYDMQNECNREFEDRHEDSEIYAYFINLKPDKPSFLHLFYLSIEIIFEIFVIYVIIKMK